MKLGSILKKYFRPGKTGQLVIKFTGEERLCKIYVENGNVTYISMGDQSPGDIPSYIAGKPLEAVNFIEGHQPPRRLDEKLNETLLSAVDSHGPSPTMTDDIWVDEPVYSYKIETLLSNFVDIIGPLGSIIAEKALASIGYQKGVRISGENYSLLLSTLLDEIPKSQKEDFKKRNL